jgi:putative transposase
MPYDMNLLFKSKVGCLIDNIEKKLTDIPNYNKIISTNIHTRFKINKLDADFYMLIPNINDGGMIGIDPGLCTFLTCTDENNNVIKIGSTVCYILKNYLDKIEKVNSSKTKNKKKKKRITSIFKKIGGHVSELHNRAIRYLTYNYTCIHIGDFGKTYMDENKITDTLDTKKYLCYDAFIEKLINKCIRLRIYIKVIDERLTTKLCHNCGYYNGSQEVITLYSCSNCGINVERDINASINIKNREG